MDQRKIMHGHFQFHYVAQQALQVQMAKLAHQVLQDQTVKQLQIHQQLQAQQEQLEVQVQQD
jgi:hypothetical protein